MRPLVRFYGYQSDENTVTFLGESELIEIEGNTIAILEILKHCTGHSSIEEIIDSLEGSVDEELARKTISKLGRAGVLIDSSNVYSAFHVSSANPMVYPHSISRRSLAHLYRGKDVMFHEATEIIQLPRNESHFLNLLGARRSCRDFDQSGFSDQQISGLLEATCGRAELRSAPSGGGLYPTNILLAVLKETPSLRRGLYEYDRPCGALRQIQGHLDVAELQSALEDDHLLPDSSIVVFVVADMLLATKKYSNRSYRHLLLEAGHMAQNAYLFGAEQDMGIVEYGGYNDELLAKLLEIHYPTQAVLTVLIAGVPAKQGREGSGGVKLSELQKTLLFPRGPVKDVIVGNVGLGRYQFPLKVGSAKYSVPTKRTERRWGGNAFSTGTTGEEALLKVLVEAWERYVPDSMLNSSWHTKKAVDMMHDEWLNPYDIYPISEKQQELFKNELSVFNPEESWQWVIGKKYVEDSLINIPVDAIYYQRGIQHTLSRLPCIWASSNGVAAHPDKEIATQSALLELIERDALMATWYGKRSVKALPDEYLTQVVGNRLGFWKSIGCHVVALDISTDTLPVILILIYSAKRKPALSSGSAAATTYERALRKAFSEAELMALSWSKRSFRNINPEDVKSVDDHGMLYANPAQCRHVEWLLNATQLPALPKAEMSVEQALCRINPWIVDMTPRRPKTGLYVMRAIAPNLLPINFGFATEAYRHPRLNELGLQWNREFPAIPHFTA